MSYLLPIALLSLFTAAKTSVGGVQVRPFELFVVLMVLITVLAAPRIRLKITSGFLLLIPFFTWHVISAFMYGTSNGIREGLQIVVMVSFALAISINLERIDSRAASRLMVAGLVLVMVYNIGWHIIVLDAWYGWKKLINPKAVFGYMPAALGALLIFAPVEKRRLYWLLWGGLLIIVLMSGERKALLIYGFISALILARGRIAAFVPAIGAGVLLLFLIMNVFAGDTFAKQLQTVFNPFSAAGSVSSIAAGATPDSLSNAQRVFAWNFAQHLIAEKPVLGIGTNAYEDIVVARYSYLPSYLLLGIHGEFLRVTTENGIIGLAFYVLIWIAAAVRLRRVVQYFYRQREISQMQCAVLPFVLMTSPFMYLALDASGTPSFAVLVIISLMPELTHHALRERVRRRRSSERFRKEGAGYLGFTVGAR